MEKLGGYLEVDGTLTEAQEIELVNTPVNVTEPYKLGEFTVVFKPIPNKSAVDVEPPTKPKQIKPVEAQKAD